jgi:hypothetical protein
MALTATCRWKEEAIVADEEGRTFTFDCAWGGEPGYAYVPAAVDWEACVPKWLWRRRDEVIQALRDAKQVVREGPYPPLSSED